MEEHTGKKYNLRSASTEGEDDNALSLDDLDSSTDAKSLRSRHSSTFSLAPSTGRYIK